MAKGRLPRRHAARRDGKVAWKDSTETERGAAGEGVRGKLAHTAAWHRNLEESQAETREVRADGNRCEQTTLPRSRGRRPMDQTLEQGSRGRGWGGHCARRFSRHFGTGVAERQGTKGTTHWQSAKAGTSTYDSMGGKVEGRTREGIEAPEAHSERHSVTALGSREKRKGRNEEGSQKGLGEP
ncbi:hypothetical protein ERJ75_000894000 [Trypanosoma vivax]|nr:hypothetical protein ERJ75_000894000 [Trypanosoma vivax]